MTSTPVTPGPAQPPRALDFAPARHRGPLAAPGAAPGRLRDAGGPAQRRAAAADRAAARPRARRGDAGDLPGPRPRRRDPRSRWAGWSPWPWSPPPSPGRPSAPASTAATACCACWPPARWPARACWWARCSRCWPWWSCRSSCWAVVAALLGWSPDAGALLAAVPAVLLGVAAFTSLGLLLAGTVRAEGTLAVANAVWVLLLAGGGLVLPSPLGPVAAALPSGALGTAVREALGTGTVAVLPLLVLTAWAVAAALAWPAGSAGTEAGAGARTAGGPAAPRPGLRTASRPARTGPPRPRSTAGQVRDGAVEDAHGRDPLQLLQRPGVAPAGLRLEAGRPAVQPDRLPQEPRPQDQRGDGVDHPGPPEGHQQQRAQHHRDV